MTALDPQPVTLHVVRYRCPFCTLSRSAKAATIAHIGRCWSNPAARACKTCVHYELSEPGPYPEHPAWPEGCTADVSLTDGLKTGCPQWAASSDGA